MPTANTKLLLLKNFLAMKSHMRLFTIVASFLFALSVAAQRSPIDYFRPYDQDGVNMFEPAKQSTVPFDGVAVRVGGNFAQQYQMLSHSNTVDLNRFPDAELYPLTSGFNLATANLNLNVQLEDGIMLSLENYMSSRHHSEFWVKGGYIQVDKLPMFGNPDWFTDLVRVKIGHMQINYGDQQFRRSDNGNAIYNPFVGNYIMDAFATEIGGEVYLFPSENLMATVGMTAGLIKGDVRDPNPDDLEDGLQNSPSVYFKLAYDDQVTEDFRFRLSGSLYRNGNTTRNTLYGGDRAGGRFYEVMESAASQSDFSGRLNPGFSNEITSFQINPFLKYKGLEFFGTYEVSSGKASSESDTRDMTQVAGELIYRFLPREQVYVGARYNTVSGQLRGIDDDISINRLELAAGWFATKNLLLKVAYVDQQYNDFPDGDIRAGGEFNGAMIEAVVGF